MYGLSGGLAALTFWGFVAVVSVAGIWDGARKREVQHETLRRLIESGKPIDQASMDKLLNSTNGQLQQPEAFPGWLKRTAVNMWLQHQRRSDPLAAGAQLGEAEQGVISRPIAAAPTGFTAPLLAPINNIAAVLALGLLALRALYRRWFAW